MLMRPPPLQRAVALAPAPAPALPLPPWISGNSINFVCISAGHLIYLVYFRVAEYFNAGEEDPRLRGALG